MADVGQGDNPAYFGLSAKYQAALTKDVAGAVLSAACDIALVVGRDGEIHDLACGKDELMSSGVEDWRGQSWQETVTVESRQKVDDLLRKDAGGAPLRWRQVNHPMADGPDLPVRYITIPFGEKGQVLALGREMRRVAELQQELVGAQQAMEREYMQLRHTETRYRALFQMAAEAVLIVDAANRRIVDANPAAIRLLETTAGELIGRTFPEAIETSDDALITDLLSGVRRTGHAAAELVRLDGTDGRSFTVSASLFRQGNASHFLVRIAPVDGAPVTRDKSRLLDVIESMPEGFVVCDLDGVVLAANAGFLDLAQLAAKDQAIGQPLGRWLGRTDFDMQALLSNLNEHGLIRLFHTAVRGELGSSEDVEVSAVGVLDIDEPCLGFSIRGVGSRHVDGVARLEGVQSVEQLTELVGRVSLKELVRDATEMIERLSIEAALDLTGDNRASAAELLGLSRQSLYAKLHRYGIGDLPNEPQNGRTN